jgi:hypothetical protein
VTDDLDQLRDCGMIDGVSCGEVLDVMVDV